MAGVKRGAGWGVRWGVEMHGFWWRCIGAVWAALMRTRWLTVRTCTGRGWGGSTLWVAVVFSRLSNGGHGT